uniref:CSON005777 protein n=1 Tax=Culicoides sonorensis TaxID=179676 RepID=A0A336MXH9_CULSO
MADKGAHLTQSSSFLINEPSFFDAVASKSLNSYGVVKKIIDNLCHSGRNNWIRKFFTEIYFSCNILIQTYYLSNYGGSFAETFYGLTRKNKKTKGFYKKDFYFSWLCLAILPYIQIKLNNFKDNISMNIDSVDKTQQKKYKNVCIIFGKLNVILEIAKLIQFLCKLIKYFCNIFN